MSPAHHKSGEAEIEDAFLGLSRSIRIGRKTAIAIIVFAVIASTAISFVESYLGLKLWANSHGYTGWKGYGWPVMVDVFILVGEAVLFICAVDRINRSSPLMILAWAMVGGGLAMSVAGNVGAASHQTIAWQATAALAPVVAFCIVFAGVQMLKSFGKRAADRAAVQKEADRDLNLIVRLGPVGAVKYALARPENEQPFQAFEWLGQRGVQVQWSDVEEAVKTSRTAVRTTRTNSHTADPRTKGPEQKPGRKAIDPARTEPDHTSRTDTHDSIPDPRTDVPHPRMEEAPPRTDRPNERPTDTRTKEEASSPTHMEDPEATRTEENLVGEETMQAKRLRLAALKDVLVQEILEQIRMEEAAGRTWLPNYEEMEARAGAKRSWCEKTVQAARDLHRLKAMAS